MLRRLPRLTSHAVKHAAKRLPFVQEAVWTTKYLLGRRVRPFNGRWERLQEWLRTLDAAPPPSPALPPRRLLVFTSTPYWADYLLALSVVLAHRGCGVDFLWLPYVDIEGAAVNKRYERWSRGFPVPAAHDRLRLVNLLDFAPAPATDDMARLADDIADFDTCYLRCKEQLDLDCSPGDVRLFQLRRQRNLDCLRRLETFLARHSYDSALTGNGLFLEFGCFHAWCGRHGLPCASLDTFELNDQIVASQKVPAVNWDTDELWASVPHVLTPEQAARVQERIAYREDPALQSDLGARLQLAGPGPREELRARLRLDPARPVVLLCTNLAWDSAVLRHARAFPSMRDWYLQTLAWFARHPQWQLVVRTHPVEARLEQPKSVADFIDEAFPQLPENVRLVRPAEPVNTYTLMKLACLGLAYTSTVGLEMAIRGLRVLVSGHVHYAGRGFTTEPASPAEYFQVLQSALARPDDRLDPARVDLARCYFDTYFERFPKRLPWRLYALAEDLQSWPLARILAGDCPDLFLRSFDYLAGRSVPGMV